MEAGRITVNDDLETTLPNVYAIGAVRAGYGGEVVHAICGCAQGGERRVRTTRACMTDGRCEIASQPGRPAGGNDRKLIFRDLPQVQRLLQMERTQALCLQYGRRAVTGIVREVLADVRSRIAGGDVKQAQARTCSSTKRPVA